MKKSIWIKHFFCLLAFLIVGTFPAISIGNHYDFKLIGSQNGMPSIISCIYTEQKGFIWIGTPTGLIRFDGTELKKYTAQPDNENSLPNDSILQIIEDNQQTTWILTTTGIARYSLIHDNFFIPKLNNQPIIAKSICKIADGLLFGGDAVSPLSGMKFLCAEANAINAEILEMLLESKGASCTICSNGQEIVDAFASVKPGEYDMILLDVQMPVMDGLAHKSSRQVKAI